MSLPDDKDDNDVGEVDDQISDDSLHFHLLATPLAKLPAELGLHDATSGLAKLLSVR